MTFSLPARVCAAMEEEERRRCVQCVNEELSMMENAKGEQVTCENLDPYVTELKQECVRRFDIADQATALREGIGKVLDWESLRVFRAEELQQLLWSDCTSTLCENFALW